MVTTSQGNHSAPAMWAADSPVLSMDRLSVWLSTDVSTSAPLVRDATLDVGKGEIVCLVGESGSGKSVSMLAVMGLIQQQRGISTRGCARLHGTDLLTLDPDELRELRGTRMAMVFQEPMSSLDPVFRIRNQLAEALRRGGRRAGAAERDRMLELLGQVGISDPAECLRSYPHELSGGMCQRVMIAMALACEPDLLIADEPTTALDVTIQAQILELLDHLRTETGMSVLLITHDMGVAAEIADRVVVMYAGRIVEEGKPAEIFARPLHPYTYGLLASLPQLTGERGDLLPAIPGNVPDPRTLPGGCAFHPRCPRVTDRCRDEDPPLAPVAGRPVACWHADDMARAATSPGTEPRSGLRSTPAGNDA